MLQPSLGRFDATWSVLFRARDGLYDLTTAILYTPVTETYYPIALLLWRKNLRQLLQVTAATALSDQVCYGAVVQPPREVAAGRPMKPKRTILCVDEDERSLSIRKVMLETRGYRVVACSEAGARR